MSVLDNEMYLKKLLTLKEHFSIKVITGIRGVGKTKLLSMFADTLRQQGVSSESIIYINFDEMEEIYDFQQLYEFVNEKIMYLEQAYLLFDEIQRVKDWEKAINAFFVGSPVDIYMTGSNSEVISEVFLHLLSNHYELIEMQPLPFNEYLNMINNKGTQQNEFYFKKFLKYGSLPIIAKVQDQPEILSLLLSGIYNTILNKDIVSRYCVRDAHLMDSLNKFLAINIGKAITPKKIEDYLLSIGQNTTTYTLDNYLNMINESGLFRKIKRYDIKNRVTINGSEQFYCADLGIRNVLINFTNMIENEAILENIVYIELYRRYYNIFIGKINKSKISFVAFKNDKPIYFQVVPSINNKMILKKSIYPLQNIKDQYDKFIITMDKPTITDYNGIKILNILDFLNKTVDF